MQCFNMDADYSFDDFREIVSKLRSECPWDKAQTLLSLKPCFFDEAAETAAGINIQEKTGDAGNLCEEPGDLLLLIVLESRIAEEKGLFSLDDVVCGISRKMIRRHPHVFGSGFTDESGRPARKWEEIKRLEKAGKTAEETAYEKRAVKEAKREAIQYFERNTKEGQNI